MRGEINANKKADIHYETKGSQLAKSIRLEQDKAAILTPSPMIGRHIFDLSYFRVRILKSQVLHSMDLPVPCACAAGPSSELAINYLARPHWLVARALIRYLFLLFEAIC